jgi:hypothetical protein
MKNKMKVQKKMVMINDYRYLLVFYMNFVSQLVVLNHVFILNYVRASPPARPIAAPIAFWGPATKMGTHRRALGAFSIPIEAPATPCWPVGEERESGAPAPREVNFLGRGSDCQ